MDRLDVYTGKQLQRKAMYLLTKYRKDKGDKMRKYVFADIPWFIGYCDTGLVLTVQVRNRETNWCENINMAL